jgi:hypothetical protein
MSDRPGSEYVSGHDRGAFGALLAEAKTLGTTYLSWNVDLRADDSEERWSCLVLAEEGDPNWPDSGKVAYGRTGEEALRRLVDALRIAHGEGQG